MGDRRHLAVVDLGVDRHRPRADPGEDAVQAVEQDALRPLGRSQVPAGALEELLPRALDARGLGAGQRVAADEAVGVAQRRDRRDERVLGRSDVGDDRVRARRLQRRRDEPGQRGDRRGAEDDVGTGARPRRRCRRPRRARRARPRGRRWRDSGSQPATADAEPVAGGEADRAADQPDAEDRDPGRVVGSGRAPARSLLKRGDDCAATRDLGDRANALRIAGNAAASSACGPSQSAFAGSSWTSTMIPSAPAAAAASDIGSTQSLRPGAWLGSTKTGSEVRSRSAGTASRSSVNRYAVSCERMPRSQRMTRSLPSLRMYSAARQQLVERRREPAFQQHGAIGPAELGQQRVVLHVPGADLDHVGDRGDVVEVADVEQLGHDREPGALACLGEDRQALAPEPLEGVGRAPRLVGAAAEHLGIARDGVGDREGLLTALDGARAGDQGEAAVADGSPGDVESAPALVAVGMVVVFGGRHLAVAFRSEAGRDRMPRPAVLVLGAAHRGRPRDDAAGCLGKSPVAIRKTPGMTRGALGRAVRVRHPAHRRWFVAGRRDGRNRCNDRPGLRAARRARRGNAGSRPRSRR